MGAKAEAGKSLRQVSVGSFGWSALDVDQNKGVRLLGADQILDQNMSVTVARFATLMKPDGTDCCASRAVMRKGGKKDNHTTIVSLLRPYANWANVLVFICYSPETVWVKVVG